MTTFINEWCQTTEDNIGKIGYSTHCIMCICIIRRQVPVWHPIHHLSSSNWMKYRENFRQGFNDIIKGVEKEKDLLLKIKNMKDTRNMFEQLYSNLTNDDKRGFIKMNSDAWLHKITCLSCLNISEDKNKCMHHDCSGICPSCTELWDKNTTCPSCKKEQKIKCPICWCEKTSQELTKSVSCPHSVCWECYGKAFRAQKPIYNCPLCRAEFTKEPEIFSSDSEYDSDEPVYQDDNNEAISLLNELADQAFENIRAGRSI
jgi:hypothetical protein|tara:strand:+ start:1678 stop:2454 length:777 start_codon:yes stop_codon:yes gene_type:complete